MLLLHLIVTTILALTSTTKALTYYVDGSCTNHQYSAAFQDGLDQALELARRGANRVMDPRDVLMGLYFSILFKKPRSDNSAFNQVLYIFQQIANLRRETQLPRDSTNLRIYCDDDVQNVNVNAGSRWTLVPDPPEPPADYIPQKQRPNSKDVDDSYAGPMQEWEDLGNQIRQKYGTDGCNGNELYAIVNDQPMPGIIGNQEGNRSTLSVCDNVLRNGIHSLNDVPQDNDISALNDQSINGGEPGIDAFDSMTGLVLLHELTHMLPLDLTDQKSADGEGAYAWQRIVALDAEKSTINPDNFAYLGLLAKLADRGFQLSFDYDEAIAGKLVYEPLLDPASHPGGRRGRKRRRLSF